MKNFLTLKSFSKSDLEEILQRAIELKALKKQGACPQTLKGKTLAMIFEKSSTRTRVSFEVGMALLGGHAIYLNQDVSQIGRGESYGDTAKVLSRYADLILFRTFEHQRLEELAKHASVPVINGLTDAFHPCQLVADLVTLKEKGKDLSKMIVAYVGDGNNMTHSWIVASHIFGFELRVATPKGFEPDQTILKEHNDHNRIILNADVNVAVQDADVIVTDTWFSMGQEVSEQKKKAFAPFQVNLALVKKAKPDVLVLHCLPAHREEEITSEVLDGPHSVVFDEAENRLYGQMAVMERLGEFL
ncbi:MAG: ornithine carbamoyltransferase [Deltaproteobacteria bacterium]|nr:ornithine carbamoyltransferase [Deltaproteobacteria bacterium]